MSHSRGTESNEPVIDDYPVRPITENRENRIPPKRLNSQHRTLVLFSLIYFLYGSGISIYGPLYPAQARENDLNSCIYGPVIATSHFICVLFYPVACRMVSEVSSRNSLSVSVFVVGACRILFGTLNLISEKISFTAISYAIQAVEGVGLSLLIASTIVTACATNQIWKISFAIQAALCLGLVLGPIGGQVVKEEVGFDIPYYIIGGLTALSFIVVATLLKEPEQRIPYSDIPIIYWMKNKRMLIYFFIVFASFNYVGFLSVSLEYLLKQFHIKSLYAATVFSICPFVYGLTFTGWAWVIKKGLNSVMLIFIGALVILASLVLLGPTPFTSLEASLQYVSWALVLGGLGIACKSACILDASEKDLRHQKKYTNIQQQLIVPTVFMLGASLGYFCGALTAGFTDFYIGYRKATLPLFALEICTGIGAVTFALNRNYVSDRHTEETAERQPILTS